jgi:hypothetical protein
MRSALPPHREEEGTPAVAVTVTTTFAQLVYRQSDESQGQTIEAWRFRESGAPDAAAYQGWLAWQRGQETVVETAAVNT